MTPTSNPRWRIDQSIILELCVALWDLGSKPGIAELPEYIQNLKTTLPPEWVAEWQEWFPEIQGWFTPLDYLAVVGQTTWTTDYSSATLPLRELTVEQVRDALHAQAAQQGVPLDEGALAVQGVAEQCMVLMQRITEHELVRLGLEESSPGSLSRRAGVEMAVALKLLPGGPLHSRFWHWLDRFYYNHYQPWRAERTEVVEAMIAQAEAALGGRAGEGVPDLEWLPIQNPIRSRQPLARAARSGDFDLIFWAEPFELPDLLSLHPGALLFTFAGPGEIYANFRARSERIAARLKALSDPTRLIILRMIRHFSMDNTSMADFLEVSRPTVSVHAKVLREAGLINTRQQGRQAEHELIAAEVRKLFAELEEFLDLPE